MSLFCDLAFGPGATRNPAFSESVVEVVEDFPRRLFKAVGTRFVGLRGAVVLVDLVDEFVAKGPPEFIVLRLISEPRMQSNTLLRVAVFSEVGTILKRAVV
jgi:hypothetical protein